MCPIAKGGQGCLLLSPIYVTMMYGSQDITMEMIENHFFVVQGTSSGLKLTLIINHLKVKIISIHRTRCEIVILIIKLAIGAS